MITSTDMKKLQEVFATKKDLQDLKNDIVTKFDAIMGEIRDYREEAVVSAHRQSVHSDQLERLELKVFGKSFA